MFHKIPKFITAPDKKTVWFCYALIILVFLFTRLPFFLFDPLIKIDHDTFGYFKFTEQINNLQLPTFEIRTPGYPVFLFIAGLIYDKLITVVILQNLISLTACLYFLRIISKVYIKLVVPVTAALIVELSSALHLNFDTIIYSESLFMNCLLIFAGLLILAVNSEKRRYWFFCSLTLMIAIYIKPSGLFLIPVAIIIAAYILINKMKPVIFLSFVFPVIFLYLLLASYNYFTVKKFSLSPFGSYNIAGAVLPYIEKDPSFPLYINKIIDTISSGLPAKEIDIIRNSWNVDKVYDAYNTVYGENNFKEYNYLADIYYKDAPENIKYSLIEKDLKTLAYGTIDINPFMFSKISFLMFVRYFKNNYWAYFYDDFLYERTKIYLWDSGYCMNDSYRNTARSLNSGLITGNQVNITLKENKNFDNTEAKKNLDNNNNLLRKLNHFYTKAHNLLFRNFLWRLLFAFTLFFSIIKFFKSRFCNRNSMLVMIICLMNVFNAVVISLVEPTGFRYAFPLEFTYYLSAALLPLLFFTKPGGQHK